MDGAGMAGGNVVAHGGGIRWHRWRLRILGGLRLLQVTLSPACFFRGTTVQRTLNARETGNVRSAVFRRSLDAAVITAVLTDDVTEVFFLVVEEQKRDKLKIKCILCPYMDRKEVDLCLGSHQHGQNVDLHMIRLFAVQKIDFIIRCQCLNALEPLAGDIFIVDIVDIHVCSTLSSIDLDLALFRMTSYMNLSEYANYLGCTNQCPFLLPVMIE